jgi:hypothetical protein
VPGFFASPLFWAAQVFAENVDRCIDPGRRDNYTAAHRAKIALDQIGIAITGRKSARTIAEDAAVTAIGMVPGSVIIEEIAIDRRINDRVRRPSRILKTRTKQRAADLDGARDGGSRGNRMSTERSSRSTPSVNAVIDRLEAEAKTKIKTKRTRAKEGRDQPQLPPS